MNTKTKRIFRLLNQFREQRRTIRELRRAAIADLNRYLTLQNEFKEYENRMNRLFKYEVREWYNPENRAKTVCLQLSESAIKMIRDPQVLIMDVARTLYYKITS